jgi:hypothetical protein
MVVCGELELGLGDWDEGAEDVPRVCNYNVVKGCMFLAEAREADSDDHFGGMWAGLSVYHGMHCGGGGVEVRDSLAEPRFSR